MAQYDSELWNTELLLIPANLGDHWILFAVTNMHQAVSKSSVAPPLQTITEGELKPDNETFSILALNPQDDETKRSLKNTIKAYLEWHHQLIKQDELQYVSSYDAKVSDSCSGWTAKIAHDQLSALTN